MTIDKNNLILIIGIIVLIIFMILVIVFKCCDRDEYGNIIINKKQHKKWIIL